VPLLGQDARVDEDEMDALLVRIRHRDAVRILIVSSVVGVPLLASAVLGFDWGSFWDQVLTGVLGLAVFAAATAALHLHRNRQRSARVIRMDAGDE